jgi:hypothetical protein
MRNAKRIMIQVGCMEKYNVMVDLFFEQICRIGANYGVVEISPAGLIYGDRAQ